MTSFFDLYGISRTRIEAFRTVHGYVDTDGEVTHEKLYRQIHYPPEHPKFSRPYPHEYINFFLDTNRERILSQYTVEEIRFVLSNIDRDFEREVLHYSYDDVDQYLDDRIAGRKTYGGPPTLDSFSFPRRLQLIYLCFE